MESFDLKAHRCPKAFIMVRTGVELFLKNSKIGDKLAIQTIEPSIQRDLLTFINAQAPQLTLSKVITGSISDESIENWQDDFDVEDWLGCKQSLFILEFSAD